MASVRSSWVGGVSGATSLQTPVGALSAVTGDTIGVWFNYGSNADPTSVVDTAGNTYTQRAKVERFGSFTSFLYTCENAVGDPNLRVTLNIGFTEYPTLAVAVIQDALTSGALDALTTSGTDTAQPWELSSGVLSQADEIVFGFLGCDSGTVSSDFIESSGMTKLGQVTDSSLYWTGALAYVVVASTAARTQSWTNTAGGSNSTQIVASFRGAAAPSGITGAGGIASAAAVGAPSIGAGITAAGIPTAQAVGSPTVQASITSAGGIASAAAVGAPSIGAGITAAGIPSAAAVGQPSIGASIAGAGGIASAEAVGQPIVGGVDGIVGAGGIPSAVAVGQPAVGASIIGAGGIPSAAAVGLPIVGDEPPPAPGGGMGFEMGGDERRVRTTYRKPLLQRILEERYPRVKPKKERAQRRAKAIEVQAAELVLEEPNNEAGFAALARRWQEERPFVPPALARVDPMQLFAAQVAFRLRQQQQEAQALAILAAKRARDDEDALIALLLA